MSEPVEIPLNAIILAMFREMEIVFSKFGIDFYIAGALARDIYIHSKKGEQAFRKTDDVDIAVCIGSEERYNDVMDALEASGSFKRDEKKIIRLHYSKGIEVDVIPFGEIEDDEREVKLKKPKAFTLQMPGFLETFPFVDTVQSSDLTLKTCPVEGLIMLKFLAWDDRPERTHDLTDIESIVDAYFGWNADEIYEHHHDIFDKYDDAAPILWEKVIAAHVIGRKMKPMLAGSPGLFGRLVKILNKRSVPEWRALMKGLREQAKN